MTGANKMQRGFGKNENDSWFSGPMMTVLVGKEEASWNIHKNMLCRYSPYFRKVAEQHKMNDGTEKPDSSSVALARIPRAPAFGSSTLFGHATNRFVNISAARQETSSVLGDRFAQSAFSVAQILQQTGSQSAPVDLSESQPINSSRLSVPGNNDDELQITFASSGRVPSQTPAKPAAVPIHDDSDDDVVFQGAQPSSKPQTPIAPQAPQANDTAAPQFRSFSAGTPSRTTNIPGPSFQPKAEVKVEDHADIIHRMPKDRAKIFGMLVRWIYGTEMMPLRSAGGPTRKGVGYKFPPPDEKENPPRDFIDLYLLGQKLQMRGPCNVAIDTLYDYFGTRAPGAVRPRSPALEDVLWVFANTTPESKLRELMMVHVNLWIFGEVRRESGLPPRWKLAIQTNSELGFEIIDMMTKFGWVIGQNIPAMTVRSRDKFMEPGPPRIPEHLLADANVTKEEK